MRAKVMRYIILFTFLITSVSCTPHSAGKPAQTQTLMVLAAASLTGPFSELGQLLEAQYPNSKVEFNFAGSQQLAQQLSQGAPADIFASASPKNMDSVIQAGRVAKNAPQVFVKNRLVLIYPRKNSAGVARLKDLAKPGLKLVFAAQGVPVGQYSLDFLDKASNDPEFGASFKEQVLKNVVSYEENVKAVYTKVALGEADAGIVYLSDITQDGAEQIGSLEIPAALNVIATYPIAAIADSNHPDLAKAFIDLVLSATGQQVLQKYHFIPVLE
jgi:molybdate transport system substrate-binding protein